MNNPYLTKVVIIGGGPAGLGAALMLAKRGCTDITVLEKRPSAAYYEPD
ncbi:MAG: FAD-dependent oxidoreductase, partial [Xenococcaceae cyanobacterium MO_167.B52]|nr:FAD-dependent oxidoreductase [Xenococcaceae cyanobacterium MO_167.B52]